MTPQATPPAPEALAEIIEAHTHLEGPLLPMLRAMQAAFGFVPASAVPMIANALKLTRAEVHGVISFYHDFREAPAGRHMVRICRAEACQAMGGAALSDAVLSKLGIGWGETTPDGAVTVEPVYCLGLCACAPAAMVDGKLMGRADADRLTALAAEGAA